MKKTNEFLIDGVAWSIIEKWSASSKEEKIKTIIWAVFVPLVSLLFSFWFLCGAVEILGIIAFFKLKNGNNELHTWLLFGYFVFLNGLFVAFLFTIFLGMLLAPFSV